MAKAIVDAAKAGDAKEVRRLLEADPELVNVETEEGSLLLTAVYNGAPEVAALLADRMPNLTIFEAAALGDADRLRALLEDEADRVDAMNGQGFTPLGLAAFFGHEDALRTLLDLGAEVDLVQKSINANTALDSAVAADRMAAVKLLLERGAEPNVHAVRGYTPLHKAAFGGNAEMVRLLLSRGADPAAETDEGRRPLDIAEERGHGDAADALREQGT